MDWRNPFENFRDKYLSLKRVKAYKLALLRYGYIPFSADTTSEYDALVRSIWGSEIPPEEVEKFTSVWGVYRDLGVRPGIQPWITKFFNARLSVHLGSVVCVDEKGEEIQCPVLRIPVGAGFLGIVYRWNPENYFQAGGFIGPDYEPDRNGVYASAAFCAKFRFGNYKREYLAGGNFDVYGFYEGII